MADSTDLALRQYATPPLPAAYTRYVSYDYFKNQQYDQNPYVQNEVAVKESAISKSPDTPLPAAYNRHIAYDCSENRYCNSDIYVKENGPQHDSAQSVVTTIDSLKGKKEQEEVSTGKRQKSLLILLRDSRIYIRVIAVVIMILSLSLIVTAVTTFAKAQKKPGHPLDSVPKPTAITDHPCIVFSGVAAMNLVLSISTICLSCMSSKFRKSNEALNAVFTIISAIGFASSMGACFFLNKQSTLQVDLWKWSCGNHQRGIVSDAMDFNLVCQVVSYGWRFGLVQACLELLTFIISITAFVILKYSYFVRYGFVGKVF